MIILHILVFVLASHICTLGYLLGYLPNKASLLDLLLLSLRVLPLYFLPLLGLFKAFRLLSPMAFTILQLKLLLFMSAFTPFIFFVRLLYISFPPLYRLRS